MLKKILNNQNAHYLLLLFITLIIFKIVYGLKILNPTNTGWMLDAYHDWGQHYLSWATFKSEPWHFPLGDMKHFNYPAGSNVGFTDSIPILALFFKLLSPVLPQDFQYYGIWFFLCHFLLGVYTIKILRIYNFKTIYLFIAAILIMLNPVLLYRSIHPALCGHWFLLASLYNYLRVTTTTNANAVNKNQIGLLLFSSLVNPYLFLMTVGFNIILPFKNYFYDKVITLKKAILFFLSAIFLVIVAWLIVGMIRFDNSGLEVADSYGMYGLNLNSFYNAQGFSKITPQLDLFNEKQYEGFSYFGVGFFILFIISTTFVLRHLIIHKYNIIQLKKFTPLIILTIALSLFAITNTVTYGSKEILHFNIPSIIVKVGNVFRASGRFIWLLYYLLFVFAIQIFLKKRISDFIKIPILLLITAIQIYDISPLMNKNLPSGSYNSPKISQDKWFSITSGFDRIVTYPPFNNHLLNYLDYQDLCFVALKNKLPITCGYVARDIGLINNLFQKEVFLTISEGNILNKNDIYITTSKDIEAFIPLLYNKTLSLRFLDGYYYLFTNNHKINIPVSLDEKRKIDEIYKRIKTAMAIENIAKPILGMDNVKTGIEKHNLTKNIFQCNGWAYIDGTKDNKKDSIYIILTNNKNSYRLKVKPVARPDVTTAMKNGNLDNSGFNATIFTNNLSYGTYDVIVGIFSNKKWYYKKLDQNLDLNKIVLPKVINEIPKINYPKKTIGNIDDCKILNGELFLNGWAAFKMEDTKDSKIKLVLYNNKIKYELETQKVQREDVTSFLKNEANYNESGFKSKNSITNFKKGKYKILIVITNSKNKSSTHQTDKTIEI